MGISSKPRIADYWSTHPLFRSPIFTSVMSRNRYQIISKFLHFADNSVWDHSDPNRDRLHKVRPLITYMNSRFQNVYVPTQGVAIDEQMLLYKWNAHANNKMADVAMKRSSHYGIKVFVLCDKLGYTYNTECYAGKNAVWNMNRVAEESNGELGKSGNVVMRLMKPLLGKGHHLYCDSS